MSEIDKANMPLLLHMQKDIVMHKFHLKKEGEITIGRKSDNDIMLQDKTVSGHHARLVIRQHQNPFMNVLKEVVVEDLGSTNGTYLNGERVKVKLLKHLDVIKIGDHSFRFEDDLYP